MTGRKMVEDIARDVSDSATSHVYEESGEVVWGDEGKMRGKREADEGKEEG